MSNEHKYYIGKDNHSWEVGYDKGYQQGRADAINECIELVLKTCFVHFPCDDETIDFYLTVKQDVMKRMEQLKEQK